MNLKEAEEIIKEQTMSMRPLEVGKAKGFLECHEAMKPLVEKLEEISAKGDYYSKELAEEALADYRKM